MSTSIDARTVVITLPDATVAHAFARILEMRGHHAFVASGFDEALEYAPFDVIVGEFGLPARHAGLSIDELTHALRALGNDPMVVAIAGEPSDRDLQDLSLIHI